MVRRLDVVRIEAGGARGTGFLVAPDRLLTALHVVGAVEDGELVLHGRVSLRAAIVTGERVRSPVHHVTPDDLVAFDCNLDWVCFRIDAEAFADVPVLRSGGDSALAPHDRWATYGFPDDAPDDGAATAGSISSIGAMVRFGSARRLVLQLYSLEAGAGIGGAVRGYSGAPVVVGGAAVAFVSSAAVTEHGESRAGTLYAVPLGPIAQRLGLVPAGLFSRPLPADIGYPPTPFRGLHRYRREDARILFGRDRDALQVIGALEHAALGIVLLTGQAGTGKSSLLEAGVLPRLEHGFACHLERVERGDVRGAWARATGGDWLAAEAAARRPLLVAIDQLEDAWRDGGDALEAWIREDLARCIDGGAWLPRGRLILSFRKEWSAEIQQALNANGASRWHHVHLQPLDRAAILEVVGGIEALERYRVGVEPGLGERIANELLADPAAPRTPTLQVWLTELHTRAPGPPHRLTLSAFDRLLRDGASLGDFLDRQLATVAEPAFESGLALDLLAFHVGPLATAIARTTDALRAAYAHVPIYGETVRALEAVGLLIPLAAGSGHRLIHDTLGPIVRDRARSSNRPAQRARTILDGHRLEWRRGPKVDDARGRLALLLDWDRLGIVERARDAMRRLDDEDAALVTASLVAQEVRSIIRDLAYASISVGIQRLLETLRAHGEDLSPSVDALALARAGSPHLRLLGWMQSRATGISADGSTLVVATADQLWIAETADLSSARSFPAPRHTIALTASPDGRWVAGAGLPDLCVVDTRSNTQSWHRGYGFKPLFVANTGHVFLMGHNIICCIPPDSAPPRLGHCTGDAQIDRCHGITGGTSYLVCEETSGPSKRSLIWFDLEARSQVRPLADSAVVVPDPYKDEVVVLSENVAIQLDLATGAVIREISPPPGSCPALACFSPEGLHVAMRLKSHVFFDLQSPLSFPFELRPDERLLAVAATADERFAATSMRYLRHDGRATVEVPVSFSEPATKLVARDGFALCSHGDHHLRAIDFEERTETALRATEPIASARVPRACVDANGLLLLVGPNVRPGHRPSAVVPPGLELRHAHLAADAIATCDAEGTLTLLDPTPRRLGTVPLASGEAVVELARSAETWLAMTSLYMAHAFTSDGEASFTCLPPGEAAAGPALVDISPDGRWLIAGGGAADLEWPFYLWRLGPGPRDRRAIPLPSLRISHDLHHAFSSDGRWLATSPYVCLVEIWELGDDPDLVWKRAPSAGDGSGRVLAMRFRTDGCLVVAWSCGIDVIDPRTGAVVDRSIPSEAYDALLSPGGVWCVRDQELCSTADLSRQVELPPRPRIVAIDDRARWLVAGDTERWLFPIDPYGPNLDHIEINLGHPRWVWLSPDGELLITLDVNGSVRRLRLDAVSALHEQLVIPPRAADPE